MLFLMHIGKTGGTTIKERIRAGFAAPKKQEPQVIDDRIVLLNHATLAEATETFGPPDAIAFPFRDPLARFLSGFYCRQRAGWPQHKARWDAGEAAAFAHFSTANALAEALGDADPARRAAADFAMQAIRHLRRGYAYHLGPLAHFMLADGDKVTALIETNDLGSGLNDFVARLGVPARQSSAPAPQPTPPYPRDLSETAVANLRSYWSDEFQYYEALKELRDHIMGQAPP